MIPIVGIIVVSRDADGVHHFATDERPHRIVVDINNLSIGFGWMNVNSVRKTITFSLDGEVLVYRRIGKDPHGWWVCDRVQHDVPLQRGDRTSDDPQAEVAR